MELPKREFAGLELRVKYHLADFGCGSSVERLRLMASKHPRMHFLGIDPALERTSREGNLDLIKASANNVLPSLHDGSIGIANADYLVGKFSDEQGKAFFTGLKPKLEPNARFYVGHIAGDAQRAREVVSQNGYTLSESKSVEELKLPLTPSGREIIKTRGFAEKLSSGQGATGFLHEVRAAYPYINNPKALTPLRFVARLKKGGEVAKTEPKQAEVKKRKGLLSSLWGKP